LIVRRPALVHIAAVASTSGKQQQPIAGRGVVLADGRGSFEAGG
jgi:hypothetical protein